MDLLIILIFLGIGGVAGWGAGLVMKEGGFGLLGNIIIGAVGGVGGGLLFKLLALVAGGVIGSIFTALIGAVALLSLARWFQGR